MPMSKYRGLFSYNSVLKYGQYSRAVYNGKRTVQALLNTYGILLCTRTGDTSLVACKTIGLNFKSCISALLFGCRNK